MEIGTKVRFIRDILTWNGKSRRAKMGDTGQIRFISNGTATIRRDGKAHMIYDVPVSALEVIQ